MRLCSLLLLVCVYRSVDGGVVLQTELGELEGQELTTPSSRTYYSFTSIPYAKPPVGNLRLKNPVPHGSWSGKLDATKSAPICTQIFTFFSHLRNTTLGQEDCLYLNIYTPTIDSSRKLPVLIYVHGGGFRCGSPGPPEIPTYLMDEDAVLVTIHYRLGALGFLSTEDDGIPGNFGLKDQALAVKWVYENIEQFGGDPSSLIAFGVSAGGASVHYLITSPSSRDYLQGAIAQSGVIDAAWALAPPGRGRRYAKRLGKTVGCSVDGHFLECLQRIDAKELMTMAEKEFLVWDFEPSIVFQPVIEVKNDGAFMTEDPRQIEVKKTLITGVVPGEGLLKSGGLMQQDETVLDEFINNIDKCLEAMLFVDHDTHPRSAEFINAIKAKYFNDLENRQEVLQAIEDVFSENYFIYPLHLALKRHSGPKYSYVFHHRAEVSYVDLAGPKKLDTKVPSHGDETFSLFNWDSIFPDKKGREEDKKVSEKLVKMWINISKYQNPTPEGFPIVWNQYSNGNVLHIKTHSDEMGPLGMDDVIDFWAKTYSILKPEKSIKTEL